MKHILITQARNESIRLKNWVAYHASQGIDALVFFDDYSTDDTKSNLVQICQQYNVDLHYNITDGFGDIFETGNSESYGHSQSCNHRIIRSLSYGLYHAQQTYTNAICYCLDVDEYMVSNSDNTIADIVEKLFADKGVYRIYCHSFDVFPSYSLTEWITNQPQSCYRWSFESRNKSIFRSRGKSITLPQHTPLPLPLASNVVHDLGLVVHHLENYKQFDMLRIHHFRNPPLVDNNYNIEFCEDYTLINKTQGLGL